MEIVLLVIQVFVALAIIAVILIQPPENIGLGGMGNSNPMAGVSTRGQGSGLTRATAILATLFIVISLILAILTGANKNTAGSSILDAASNESTIAPPSSLEEAKDAAKATPDAKSPATEEVPAVPLAK